MTLEQLCETSPCRKDTTVDLQAADGSRFTRSYPLLPPAVHGSLISVVAGETVLVEADAEASAERPTNFVRVDKVTHPERTLTFKFEQRREKGSTFMMLTSTNPFPRDIRLRMSMVLLSSGKIARTSSCPVVAGRMGIEIWPDPLFQILIDDIRFMEAGEPDTCIE